MNNNWETLRSMLLEQLEDIRHKRSSSGNYSTCSKCYNEVLKVMDAIDNNTQNLLHPFNCVWKTNEEMEEIKNESNDYVYTLQGYQHPNAWNGEAGELYPKLVKTQNKK